MKATTTTYAVEVRRVGDDGVERWSQRGIPYDGLETAVNVAELHEGRIVKRSTTLVERVIEDFTGEGI